MRTTVRIDDDLYKQVKARAVEEGRTVAAVLEDSVRRGMQKAAAAEHDPVTLPTVDGPFRSDFHTISYGNMLEVVEEGVPPEERKAL